MASSELSKNTASRLEATALEAKMREESRQAEAVKNAEMALNHHARSTAFSTNAKPCKKYALLMQCKTCKWTHSKNRNQTFLRGTKMIGFQVARQYLFDEQLPPKATLLRSPSDSASQHHQSTLRRTRNRGCYTRFSRARSPTWER